MDLQEFQEQSVVLTFLGISLVHLNPTFSFALKGVEESALTKSELGKLVSSHSSQNRHLAELSAVDRLRWMGGQKSFLPEIRFDHRQPDQTWIVLPEFLKTEIVRNYIKIASNKSNPKFGNALSQILSTCFSQTLDHVGHIFGGTSYYLSLFLGQLKLIGL